MANPPLSVAFSDGDPAGERVWHGPRKDHTIEMWRHLRDMPDGETRAYYRFVSRTAHPCVIVLPVTAAGEIGLQQTWRPVIGQWVWETPRGFGESDDPIADAARELKEETGLTAADLIPAGRLYPDTGIQAEYAELVIACMVKRNPRARRRKAAPQKGADDSTELRGFRFFPRHKVNEMIVRGDIVDGYTLGAIARLDAAVNL